MAQKFNIRFQKNNWWGLLAFAGAGSLVYIFLFFSHKGEYPFKLANADVFIFSMLLSAICYISYFLLNRITDRYFNWRKHFALRFFVVQHIATISVVRMFRVFVAPQSAAQVQ